VTLSVSSDLMLDAILTASSQQVTLRLHGVNALIVNANTAIDILMYTCSDR
jgi:hypothetical protein